MISRAAWKDVTWLKIITLAVVLEDFHCRYIVHDPIYSAMRHFLKEKVGGVRNLYTASSIFGGGCKMLNKCCCSVQFWTKTRLDFFHTNEIFGRLIPPVLGGEVGRPTRHQLPSPVQNKKRWLQRLQRVAEQMRYFTLHIWAIGS